MLELKTDRLDFRQWNSNDFPVFGEFFSREENAKYVGGVKSEEEAWRLMASYVGHYQLKGFSYLPVEERDTGRLVGTVGLWKSDPWPELELGYWLLPSMQGKGYAVEAAQAVLDFAFQSLKMPTLVSYIDLTNVPSIRLAERLGAERDSDIELLQFGTHGVFRYRAP